MNTAFKPADILLPKNTDMNKWAVIACDQFTSEPEYWHNLEDYIGDEKSSLNLILPEAYLECRDSDEKIKKIHENMKKYLEDNIFTEYKDSMVYIERIQSNDVLRRGVLGMIDLEKYDFSKGSTSEVRATEATVVERIPPRIKVRDRAPLELPHIMILIDDEKNTAVDALAQEKSSMKKLYDFDLNAKGGHITGWLMEKEQIEKLNLNLAKLGDPENFKKKYNRDDVLLYAVGDGNHSLATAKTFYENLKKANPEADFSNHPARYALAEIVNLHSPALDFEAIHRIVHTNNPENLISILKEKLALSEEISKQPVTIVQKNKTETLYIHNQSSNLAVGSLQNCLDDYLNEKGGKIDYIHGNETLKKLVSENENSVGFILPTMDKSELFETVIKDGALPRKTFSMGHAEDKRYYIECRKIQ